MECVRRKAYAKINLGLDVLRRRPDGYHEVKMIMQTVDIWDMLTFKKCGKPDIFLSVDNKEVPAGRDNLIYKAAEILRQEYGIGEGVEIHLEKHIPIAAGMAGGSTDAAAVFHGMNELFGLSMTLKDMQKLGVKIGADVPYCLMGGTALSEGIGEKLTPLPLAPECILAVAKPEVNVSTRFVYENLHLDQLTDHPDIDGMAEAIRQGNLLGIAQRLGNVLETVTVPRYPVIGEIKRIMCQAGAENALMSGSGPTVFGIFWEMDGAKQAVEKIRKAGLAGQVFVTGFYGEGTGQ